MSKRVFRAVALGSVVLLIGVGAYAVAGADASRFRGTPLNGYEENPDVSTGAQGSFEARLSSDGTSLTYELNFGGIEGGNVLQSHIHFGKPAVNGGISIFLCTNLGNGPAGTQLCPAPDLNGEVVVTGTVDADDVIGPNVQGIAPREFDEIIAAMRAGNAYVNVHSTFWPGGEIRAQIRAVRGNGD